MTRLAGWIGRHELLFLLTLAPALIFMTPGRVWVLGALPALWACRRAASGRFVPDTPLNAPILALLLAVLVSEVTTPNIIQSLPKISNVLLGVALTMGTVAWTTTERRREWLLVGMAVLGLALATVALFATNWPQSGKVPALEPTEEALGHVPSALTLPGAASGINPNEVGGVLAMFVPLMLAATIHEGAKGRPSWARVGLYALTCAGLLVGTVLTQSRASMLGLVVGLLSLPAWRRWSGRLALAAALAAVAWLALTGRLEPLLAASGLVGPAADFETLNGRLGVWQRALYFMGQAPLTGIGLNQFRLAVPAFWPLAEPLAHGDLGHAHNMFLQVGVELGALGLAAFAGLWAALGWRVVSWLRAGARGAGAMVGLGAASGLLAALAYGMFDAVALGARAGFPWWLFLALALIATSSADGHGVTPQSID